jgi:hypothetical protein
MTVESQAMLLGDSTIYMKREDVNDIIEKKNLKKASTYEREKWSNKMDFFFSGLGYTVGLSNVWRSYCGKSHPYFNIVFY